MTTIPISTEIQALQHIQKVGNLIGFWDEQADFYGIFDKLLNHCLIQRDPYRRSRYFLTPDGTARIERRRMETI